jgi:hypothetical protein
LRGPLAEIAQLHHLRTFIEYDCVMGAREDARFAADARRFVQQHSTRFRIAGDGQRRTGRQARRAGALPTHNGLKVPPGLIHQYLQARQILRKDILMLERASQQAEMATRAQCWICSQRLHGSLLV